jgi:hypothetical protein
MIGLRLGGTMRLSSRTFLLAALLGCATVSMSTSSFAKGDAKKAPAKTDPKAAKKAPPKKSVAISAENKKKLAELFAGYKFGQTKDEVVGILAKQLDQRYEDKIKATTDVAAQDRLRKEKKTELARANQSYTTFDGKRGGWDVSIVENEFAHNTGESMFERWENQDGRNQRRFFFFHDGKLWKMFVQLDVSILPEDKKNFESLVSVMTAKYGPGDVEPGEITWNAGEFQVHAVDKLKTYDALALVIEDPREKRELVALRESKAAPKPETSPVIKAVIDPEHKDKLNVKGDNSAVDAVIKAQGAGAEPKK